MAMSWSLSWKLYATYYEDKQGKTCWVFELGHRNINGCLIATSRHSVSDFLFWKQDSRVRGVLHLGPAGIVLLQNVIFGWEINGLRAAYLDVSHIAQGSAEDSSQSFKCFLHHYQRCTVALR